LNFEEEDLSRVASRNRGTLFVVVREGTTYGVYFIP